MPLPSINNQVTLLSATPTSTAISEIMLHCSGQQASTALLLRQIRSSVDYFFKADSFHNASMESV